MRPGAVLFEWFTKIPPGHATYIAHLYLICMGKDMGPFFLEPSEVLGQLQNQIVKDDLPLRVAARMVAAIAAIDLILVCQGPDGGLQLGEIATRYTKVVDLAGPLWQRTIDSWSTFSQEKFSPRHIAYWLKATTQA